MLFGHGFVKLLTWIYQSLLIFIFWSAIFTTSFLHRLETNIKQSSLLVGHPHHQLLAQEEVSSIQASTTMKERPWRSS